MDDAGRLAQAIADNVAWCDAVCRAAGGDPADGPVAWVNRRLSPPGYPNLITRSADAAAVVPWLAGLVGQFGALTGWGVKDSHATLALAARGFECLVEGQWLHRAPAATPATDTSALHWRPVREAAALDAWPVPDAARAPALRADTAVTWLGGHDGGHPVCGLIVSRHAGVLGLSNDWAGPGAPPGWRAAAVAAAQALAPGWPQVGWAADDELPAWLPLGFRAVGPMRVWLRAGS